MPELPQRAFCLAPISSALGPSSCFSDSAQGVTALLMRSLPVGENFAFGRQPGGDE